MKRLSASLLVVGLAVAGNAAAQSSGYYPAQQDRYSGSSQGATYDYARVLRVDPVIESGYGNRYGNRSTQGSQQCYYRQADDVYTGNGGYDDRYGGYRGNNNGYGDSGYGQDGYYDRNNGYRNTGGSVSRSREWP